VDGGQLLFDSHVVLEVSRGGGAPPWRVGVFGLTEPLLLWLLDQRPHADPVEQATAAMVEELRGQVDYLIALAHTSRKTGEELARRFPELDLVCGVHGQDPTPGHRAVLEPQSAESSLQLGKGLGGRRVFLGEGRGTDGRYRVRFAAVALSDRYPDHAEVVEARQAYREDLERLNVLPDPAPVEILFAGADTCVTCHPTNHETWSKTAHAHAWQTLQERTQQYDLECTRCHSLELDSRARLSDPRALQRLVNVQCEHCHGDARAHVANPEEAIPTRPTSRTCTRCHHGEHDDRFRYDRDLPLATCVGGS
jgi:hypothetical protein